MKYRGDSESMWARGGSVLKITIFLGFPIKKGY